MYLTANELRMILDGLNLLLGRHHHGTPKYRAVNKLRGEFQHQYDTVRVLDLEAAKR